MRIAHLAPWTRDRDRLERLRVCSEAVVRDRDGNVAEVSA